MLTTRVVSTNGWHTTVSDTAFVLSSAVVDQCLALVKQANATFVHEDTAVRRLTGEPTLFGRLDFTITANDGDRIVLPPPNGHFAPVDGLVQPYEWEERAAGMGVVTQLNPQFARLFADIRRDWPELQVVVSPDRRGYDDEIWAGPAIQGPHAPSEDRYVIVRAEPEQTEYHHLASRSLSTVATKGAKSYGAKLGWWSEVTSLDELPAPGTTVVVLKPLQGSKTKGLLIAPPTARQRQRGMITRTKLEQGFTAQVANGGSMYLQPWHPPMIVDRPELSKHNLVLRVFFARSLPDPTWHCLGGTWNLRPGAVVHGATDTIFGPVILD